MANQIKGHVDQYLTDYSVAYRNTDFVADIISPIVNVQKSADKYVVYDKSNYRIGDNTYNSGDTAKKVNFEISEGTYRCEEYALEHPITDKELKNYDKPLDAETDAVDLIMEKMLLAKENRVIQIATDTSLVPNNTACTYKWTDLTNGVPKKDIFTAVGVIGDAIQKAPNTIVMGWRVALALAQHTNYTNDYKSGTDLVGKFGLPAVLWGLNTHVVTTAYASTDEIGTSDPTLSALWSDTVLVAYIDPNAKLKSLTFMKTFVGAEGSRRVIKGDYQKLKHCYDVQVYEETDEKLICASAGYLILDTL